jgi:hypothetical protein
MASRMSEVAKTRPRAKAFTASARRYSTSNVFFAQARSLQATGPDAFSNPRTSSEKARGLAPLAQPRIEASSRRGEPSQPAGTQKMS